MQFYRISSVNIANAEKGKFREAANKAAKRGAKVANIVAKRHQTSPVRIQVLTARTGPYYRAHWIEEAESMESWLLFHNHDDEKYAKAIGEIFKVIDADSLELNYYDGDSHQA